MSIIFGYACISDLNPKIKTGSTSTLTYINRLGEPDRSKHLRPKALANLESLKKLLLRNAQNNIRAYRLPDSLLPMADLGYYDIAEFEPLLRECGAIANQHDIYLSFHPSQFFVLNSATPRVVDSTIKNLEIFAKILHMMQLKNHPTLLLHVGARSTYRTIEAAADAFCTHSTRLSPLVLQYLAVENDQSAHSIYSCLRIHNQIGIPVVFDSAHWAYNPTSGIQFDEAVALSLSTWGSRVPKVHISSELEGSNRHAHADYIAREDAAQMYSALQSADKVILMVEAKKKDSAVQKLPFYSTLEGRSI